MIRKRSVSLRGHRTSFSLEDAFFEEIKMIANRRAISLAGLLSEIDDARTPDLNLSSAVRLFVLDDLKARLGE
ncbi:ribbon-helix-helix domain-containing protein [Martelella sp. AD-3]|uniref:ribbon-helix-helix domain-containing protein n=1 Tax=Martelella sp. AD-3 TaxID=686597 RepID=UPI00046502C2|nr:ribbon-helix-helix domain-containing protein [Martelella sp. AD-3]AMM84328.1 aryl-sulfate sulfotransferase [Martelella sp. AD-3]